MSTSTPWGMSDYQKNYAHGIIWYGTPSHGGFHVSPSVNARIPDYMRCNDGWYEEDCDWCIVATIFPAIFASHETPEEVQRTLGHARDTLRNWHPAAYERYYGVTLNPGESYVKDHPRQYAA